MAIDVSNLSKGIGFKSNKKKYFGPYNTGPTGSKDLYWGFAENKSTESFENLTDDEVLNLLQGSFYYDQTIEIILPTQTTQTYNIVFVLVKDKNIIDNYIFNNELISTNTLNAKIEWHLNDRTIEIDGTLYYLGFLRNLWNGDKLNFVKN